MTARLPGLAAAIALCSIVTTIAPGAAIGRDPEAAAAPAPGRSGAKLFKAHCGVCHLQMGTGTVTLARRVGWRHALLSERTDLNADYVKYAVRNGIGSMPPQTRVDLSDADLDRIAAYLARPASERNRPRKAGERSRHE